MSRHPWRWTLVALGCLSIDAVTVYVLYEAAWSPIGRVVGSMLGVLLLVASWRFLEPCRHEQRLRERNADGSVDLVCERCGDRVPVRVTDYDRLTRLRARLDASRREAVERGLRIVGGRDGAA